MTRNTSESPESGKPSEPTHNESAVAVFFKGLLMLIGICVTGVFVFAGLVLATCFLAV